MKRLLQSTVVRYLLAGGSAFAIELGTLLGLMYFLQLSHGAATGIAFWVGLAVVFGLQKLFAFKDYRREMRVLSHQGALFATLTIWNWLFSVGFVQSFSAEYVIIARCVAQVILSGWNFFLYKYVIFARHSQLKDKLRQLWQEGFLQWAAGLVLVWRIILELVNQLVAKVINNQPFGLDNLQQWARWDGGWYLDLNRHGYNHATGVLQQENVAFFPAFPETAAFLARALHVDFVVAGILLNFVLTVACVYLLMKIAQVLAGQLGAGKHHKQIAWLSGLALLAYPGSFFFAAYYAEAMLVLGVLGAVFFALKKRLWWAVPFMALATASKVMGIIAVITVATIVFEQWWREKASVLTLVKRWAITSLGLAGLASFMLYLWVKFGNPLLFYHIQQAWGRNDRKFFITGIAKNYLHFFDPGYYGSTFYYLINVFIMLIPFAVVAVAFVAWRKYKLWWPGVLGFFVLAIPLSTGIMDSLYRYCLVAAPLLPIAFIWVRQSRLKAWMIYVICAASGAVMLFFAHGFLRGGYFAG